jgi:hypothetical protein
MHRFDPPPPLPKRRRAIIVWAIAAAILIVPSLTVWIVRGAAFALSCAPGPDPCRHLPFGPVLHQMFGLSWLIASDSFLAVILGLVAAIAALIARRPLLACLSMLILPVAALVLPALAADVTRYPGCRANEIGSDGCTLWGRHMGTVFHHAATTPNLLYNFAPYVFALAVMIALVGFAFFRPKPASQ